MQAAGTGLRGVQWFFSHCRFAKICSDSKTWLKKYERCIRSQKPQTDRKRILPDGLSPPKTLKLPSYDCETRI